MGPSGPVEWIACGVDSKGYNVSAKDRLKIRRQAMVKAGAERRRRGNYGQANKGQFPGQLPDKLDTSDGTIGSQRGNALVAAASVRESRRSVDELTLPQPMPLSAWERATTINGLNIFCLPAIRGTYSGHETDRLMSVLRRPKSSFLKYIPSRYGSSACLDHAVRAFSSKVRERLGPVGTDIQLQTWSHHGKALAALRAAVDGSERKIQADVLSSIELLGLIEHIEASSQMAWVHHVAGAAQLLRLKGPHDFATDYDKDLFISLASQIVCESLRKNELCFLREDRWQKLLNSCLGPNTNLIDERSAIGLRSVKLMIRLSSIMFHVTSFVCHGRDEHGQEVGGLINQLRDFRTAMLDQHEQAAALCAAEPLMKSADLRFELLGTTLMALATVNQLLSVLGDPECAFLEKETLRYVDEMQRLEAALLSSRGWVSFALSQKARIAESIPTSANFWTCIHGVVIDRLPFRDWCGAMGREHCNCAAS